MNTIEYWENLEQKFIHSLENREFVIAKNYFSKFINKFGKDSKRIKKLQGLLYESEEKYEEADNLYRELLKKDPTNTFIMKRQICIRKSLGDINTTIKLLNEYLKIFMADSEAWQELADLYISQQMYKNAAFCIEEVILSSSQNYHLYSRYGEILYTLGGYDNLKLARKYFCYSLELYQKSNLRALYGILMTTISISLTKQGKQDKENKEIFIWCQQKLKENYEQLDQKNPAKYLFLKLTIKQ
jgi:tetratricopeptide (TPR) repeat protein